MRCFALAFTIVASISAVPPAGAKPAPAAGAKPARPSAVPHREPATVKAVPELTTDQRQAAISKLIGIDVSKIKVGDPIELSVQKPWIDKHTWLDFGRGRVHVRGNRAVLEDGAWFGGDQLQVRFRSVAKATYFVECQVGIEIPVSEVDVEGFAVPVGATAADWAQADILIDTVWGDVPSLIPQFHHVTFVVRPNGKREVQLRLSSSSEDEHWDFRSCKMTPMFLG